VLAAALLTPKALNATMNMALASSVRIGLREVIGFSFFVSVRSGDWPRLPSAETAVPPMLSSTK
jgi:hypothetical protein